jgi:hypothetical protein
MHRLKSLLKKKLRLQKKLKRRLLIIENLYKILRRKGLK